MCRQLDELGVAAVAILAHIAGKVLAMGFQIGQAVGAMAAVQIVIGGHRIAHLHVGDAGPDLDNLGGDLVADDARRLDMCAPDLVMLDGQAGAAGQDPGHRFRRSRLGVGHIFQDERLTLLFQHQGFHYSTFE